MSAPVLLLLEKAAAGPGPGSAEAAEAAESDGAGSTVRRVSMFSGQRKQRSVGMVVTPELAERRRTKEGQRAVSQRSAEGGDERQRDAQERDLADSTLRDLLVYALRTPFIMRSLCAVFVSGWRT